MNLDRRAGALALAMCAMALAVARGQSGNELFQQALAKERAAGKLSEAIALYQRIVREDPADRALVARALVRIGSDEEQLGTDRALADYERVVRDFPDQPGPAAEARQRIAMLRHGADAVQQGAFAPATHRIWASADWNVTGAVTPDGTELIYAAYDSADGNLVARNLETGATRQLTHSASLAAQQFPAAFPAVIAPDGRTIAYARMDRPNYYALRIVGPNGAERTLIAPQGRTRSYVRPYDFTPDGKQVLVDIAPEFRNHALYLVALSDGRRTRIVDTAVWHARISPDGQWVAYEKIQDTTRKHDIYVRRMDGTGEHALIQHPADDTYPTWTPDGHGVLFASTRSGAIAGWYVPVSDGRAAGAPAMLLQTVGDGPMRFTHDGSLYYAAASRNSDISAGEIDLASGTWIAQPAVIQTLVPGHNGSPAWSPDSKQLAYVGQSLAATGAALRIHDMLSGAEREFPLGFSVVRPSWAPDGHWILLPSAPTPRAGIIYRLNVATGAVERVVAAPNVAWNTAAAFSGDGSAIYYSTGDTAQLPGDVRTKVVRRELATGAERVVYTSAAGFSVPEMSLSPDGSRLVLGVISDTSSGFIAIDVNGGEQPRFLAKADIRRGISWSPDGRSVIWPDRLSLRDPLRLLTLPADGSAPARPVSAALGTVWDGHLAPDGRHVAFRLDDRVAELWRADNFLRPSKPRK